MDGLQGYMAFNSFCGGLWICAVLQRFSFGLIDVLNPTSGSLIRRWGKVRCPNLGFSFLCGWLVMVVPRFGGRLPSLVAEGEVD